MNDVVFSKPVHLKLESTERQVASSWEALECLRDQWPEWSRGPPCRPDRLAPLVRQGSL
ncbi:DUF982 domain-containing protein [Rhizobiaceae sp. 2RAB30]